MGMMIEESIGWIKKSIFDMRGTQICISDRLALETAIDTMRKYQKIREIVKSWKFDTWTDGVSYDCMVKISEVLEDG